MNQRFCGVVVAAIAATTLPAQARVYATLGADGQLQVSQNPVAGATAFDPHRPVAVRASARGKSVVPGPLPSRPAGHARWGPLIDQVAAEHAVDAHLLHAIVTVESAYNAKARSHAGALGLMQVIPATGKRFGAEDLLDPLQNLRAGTAYLVWLHRRFNGNLELMLAAYNAGEGAVQRHGNRVPPFAETRQYVAKVTALYHSRRD
ncbi:lytic transglycosylase domain-containing protein [Stenotrophomonas sp.]|uniref:lytic transglycosylase domain-containing protein n=1 Tax=Stenotrophomonas sp. TaxID=69392 RepID=UPI00289C9469|nr:lytic transglycosylase domain-containing protein [Stenotrophomonas sp.]